METESGALEFMRICTEDEKIKLRDLFEETKVVFCNLRLILIFN